MKPVLLVVAFLMSVVPVFGQSEIVAAVKNDLIARHVNLEGGCGAFEITKRVAWVLRAQGVGLMEKSGGNNCQGYSTDWLVFLDFSGRDILTDSGGENGPAWSPEPNDPPGTYAGRWRAPFDPGDVVVVPPPGTGTGGTVPVPPGTGAFDATEIIRRLLALEAELHATKGVADETLVQLKEHRAAGARIWLRVSAIGGPIVALVTALLMRGGSQ